MVDDDHTVCGLVRAHYEPRGIEVVCAYDGHTALAFFHLSLLDMTLVPERMRVDLFEFRTRYKLDSPFGVILMDMAMPGLNGVHCVDAVRHIEKQSSWMPRRTIIIGFSAFDADMKETGLDQTTDFDHYIVKPDHRGELLPLLDQALGVA